MKFLQDWISDFVDVSAAGGTAGVRRLLEQAGLPVEAVLESTEGPVLDVEITPNRPDAMSHRGLAREIAAMSGIPEWDLSARRAEPESEGEPAEQLTSVVIQVPRLCRRFGARLVNRIQNGPASERVRRRIAAIGGKPISTAVDATNYALWDLGQPLHAFDFDRLAGGLLIVRKARRGETLVTLDGLERTLEATDLVVADSDRAVSLAGIMGGLETAVTERTRNVLIEGAWWDPVTIRRTARRLGMHTDASHRFERGADVEAIPGALRLAAHLILESAGGSVAPGLLDARGAALRVRRTSLRLSRLRSIAGDSRLTLEFAAEALTRLGFETERRGKHLSVSIPLFRQDVRREDDLIEEVLRVYGYDNLPSRLPPTTGGGSHLEPLRIAEERLSDLAAAAGLYETISFPFAEPAEEAPFGAWLSASGATSGTLVLANPLDEGRPALRATLLPGILDALSRNVRHGQRDAGLFEIGRTFARDGRPEAPESFESRRMAFAFGGEARSHWSAPPAERPGDFFDAKGMLERLLHPWIAPEALRWTPLEGEGFSRGAASVVRTPAGQVLAVVGRVAEGERDRRKLPDPVFTSEILVEAIPLGAGPPRFQSYSLFPPVQADLSFGHPRELAWGEVETFLRSAGIGDLESFRLLDRYEGPAATDAGGVKTTVRLTFRSPERTLEQEEINRRVHDVSDALRARFGVSFG